MADERYTVEIIQRTGANGLAYVYDNVERYNERVMTGPDAVAEATELAAGLNRAAAEQAETVTYTRHEHEVQDRGEITCVQCLDGTCPTQAETVKLSISIEISEQDVVDTTLTVEAWNALTDGERSEIFRDYWDAMAQNDSGGVTVLTEGAEGL